MIKKEIKKLPLVKEKECTCPMCTKTSMQPGMVYVCTKSNAMMGTLSFESMRRMFGG
jgi:hypothetical protein